jgi:hypothetical protein
MVGELILGIGHRMFGFHPREAQFTHVHGFDCLLCLGICRTNYFILLIVGTGMFGSDFRASNFSIQIVFVMKNIFPRKRITTLRILKKE